MPIGVFVEHLRRLVVEGAYNTTVHAVARLHERSLKLDAFRWSAQAGHSEWVWHEPDERRANVRFGVRWQDKGGQSHIAVMSLAPDLRSAYIITIWS